MALEALEDGGLVTVQDLGRTGWRKFGVPASGPMDAFALRAANALVDNPHEAATLEIGLGDAAFRATRDCVVAVTGAGFRLEVYIWELSLWSSFFVRGGWTVRLEKNGGGMWAYLAVAGGFETEEILGSRSAYLRGRLGRRVQVGNLLPAGKPSHPLDLLAARSLPPEHRPAYNQSPVLDVILGPQTDWFTQDGLTTFLEGEYTLSTDSDRMGYRFAGPAIEHSRSADLLSEGMAMGSIQVPASGQPIVMMADCGTTGGYPKIASIASADLPVLAQLTPGASRVRFRETTVEAAQIRYQKLVAGLYTEIVEPENYSGWAQ